MNEQRVKTWNPYLLLSRYFPLPIAPTPSDALAKNSFFFIKFFLWFSFSYSPLCIQFRFLFDRYRIILCRKDVERDPARTRVRKNRNWKNKSKLHLFISLARKVQPTGRNSPVHVFILFTFSFSSSSYPHPVPPSCAGAQGAVRKVPRVSGDVGHDWKLLGAVQVWWWPKAIVCCEAFAMSWLLILT